MGIIDNAAVAIRKGTVAWVGPEEEIPSQLEELPRLDCDGRVAVPGFVDAFCQLAGTFEQEPAPEETSIEEAATEWAGRLLAGGATCITVLVRTRGNLKEDKERLAAASNLEQQLPLDVVANWMVGPDSGIFPHHPEGRRFLREVAYYASGLSIKVGTEGFSSTDVRKLCSSMRSLRKRVRLHGSPDIPADVVRSMRPVAVQDMTQLDESTLQALRSNGGAVVVLPMASIRAQLPIQGLMDLGIPVALGTSCLPGGRSVTSMPFLAWVASEAGEVPIETALWCATYGGAQAIDDRSRGWIRSGTVGDIAILDVGNYHELANHPDLPMVWELIRAGDLTAGGRPG